MGSALGWSQTAVFVGAGVFHPTHQCLQLKLDVDVLLQVTAKNLKPVGMIPRMDES